MYKILAPHVHQGDSSDKPSYVKFDVEDLKGWLGCEKKYSQTYDLLRFAINPAIEELNESSDLHIEFDRVKTGRSVTHLRFKLKRQTYQPGLFPVQDEIPPTIGDLLKKFAYKPQGEARTYILDVCNAHGAPVVESALRLMYADYKDAPSKVRGGIIKNTLSDYVITAKKELNRKKLIEAAMLDKKIEAQAIAIHNQTIELAVMNYRIQNPEHCEEILNRAPAFMKIDDMKDRWVNTQIALMLEEDEGSLSFERILEKLKA